MAVWGGFTNSWEKKRSERQRRKGMTYPSECRVPKNSKWDTKAFVSEQCKEIEENSKMGKTGDLFKKTRDTKGTFHAKMGTIKDRNGTNLSEAEDIKNRWQEYTKWLYKKDLNDPDNHDGVITYLEPDILECEVKWVLIYSNIWELGFFWLLSWLLSPFSSSLLFFVLSSWQWLLSAYEMPGTELGS